MHRNSGLEGGFRDVDVGGRFEIMSCAKLKSLGTHIKAKELVVHDCGDMEGMPEDRGGVESVDLDVGVAFKLQLKAFKGQRIDTELGRLAERCDDQKTFFAESLKTFAGAWYVYTHIEDFIGLLRFDEVMMTCAASIGRTNYQYYRVAFCKYFSKASLYFTNPNVMKAMSDVLRMHLWDERCAEYFMMNLSDYRALPMFPELMLEAVSRPKSAKLFLNNKRAHMEMPNAGQLAVRAWEAEDHELAAAGDVFCSGSLNSSAIKTLQKYFDVHPENETEQIVIDAYYVSSVCVGAIQKATVEIAEDKKRGNARARKQQVVDMTSAQKHLLTFILPQWLITRLSERFGGEVARFLEES